MQGVYARYMCVQGVRVCAGGVCTIHVCAGGACVCRGCVCVQGVHVCAGGACVCKGCMMIAASAFRTQHAHSCKHVLHRILALH